MLGKDRLRQVSEVVLALMGDSAVRVIEAFAEHLDVTMSQLVGASDDVKVMSPRPSPC